MTSVYDYKGRRVGATVIEVEPNFVTQIKTLDTKDGYNAVQLGMGTKKSVKKPQLGQFKKSGIDQSLRFLKEVKGEAEGLTQGQQIKIADLFSAGDLVKVTGVSKGRGFAGVVKRHGFHGGPKTHGQSDRHRAPGSIGQGTTPGRVYKGKKMAGHMGNETVSLQNLEVVNVDKTNNLITIKGGIPGPAGHMVMITKTGQLKGYVAPEEPEEVVEEVAADSVDQSVETTASADQAQEETTQAVEEQLESVPAEEAASEEQPVENTQEEAKE